MERGKNIPLQEGSDFHSVKNLLNALIFMHLSPAYNFFLFFFFFHLRSFDSNFALDPFSY